MTLTTRVRVASALWLVLAAVVWNVIFDRVIVLAGRRYVYDAALSAYAKALELNPNYPDAIEYRGEAYLGLNKLDEAKAAYLALFAQSRPLADQLMTAMRRWTDARRADAQGVAPEALDAFSKWVDERSGIAAQTASLAIGAQTAWK